MPQPAAITVYQAAALMSRRTGLAVTYKALFYAIRDRSSDRCPVAMIPTSGRWSGAIGVLVSDYLALERWYLRNSKDLHPLTDDELAAVGGPIAVAQPDTAPQPA